MKPEAQLPIVYQTAANLYQAELFSLQLQAGKVRLQIYLKSNSEHVESHPDAIHAWVRSQVNATSCL